MVVVRDGTSSKGSGAHFGDKIRLLLHVMDGGKRAWNSGELDGARWKKGLWRQRKITWRVANVKVYIQALERLMEPENREVSPRYILKYSTRGSSNIFQLFDTSERQDHFVANRKRWSGSQGKRCTARAGRTSGMTLSIKE